MPTAEIREHGRKEGFAFFIRFGAVKSVEIKHGLCHPSAFAVLSLEALPYFISHRLNCSATFPEFDWFKGIGFGFRVKVEILSWDCFDYLVLIYPVLAMFIWNVLE
jgi:hypothetical protein